MLRVCLKTNLLIFNDEKTRFSGAIITVSASISDSNITPEKTQFPIRYPGDLIDEEWEILQPVFDELEPYTTGRPRTTDLREILNAIFYLNKTGCPWRYLPTDFPPYQLVNSARDPKRPFNPMHTGSFLINIYNEFFLFFRRALFALKYAIGTIGFTVILRATGRIWPFLTRSSL